MINTLRYDNYKSYKYSMSIFTFCICCKKQKNDLKFVKSNVIFLTLIQFLIPIHDLSIKVSYEIIISFTQKLSMIFS